MNIDTRNYHSANTPSFAGFGPESLAAALTIELDEHTAQARHDRHEALEQRFDAARESIDQAREAARERMIASLISTAGSIAQGACGLASAARNLSSGGSGSDSASESGDGGSDAKAKLIEGAGTLATGITGAVSTVLGSRAASADAASQKAKLDSERAAERASEAGQSVEREHSIRDQLARQLEEMMRHRHQVDEAVLGRQR